MLLPSTADQFASNIEFFNTIGRTPPLAPASLAVLTLVKEVGIPDG